MKELASGTTARDLIPGVPEDIERLAGRLIEYSEAAMTAVARLRSMDHGLWIGEAAESFSAQVGQLPAKLSRAAGAFQDAAFALRSYASVLREAQWTAGRAVELFEKATHCADQDLGGSLGAEAQRLLETARGNVEAAARRTASVVEDAGDAAPDRPGFLHRALRFAGEIAGGAVEATAGMATFAFKLTPTYQLIDPEGYVENLTGLGKGLVFGVTHPVSFAKAVVDWDTGPRAQAGQSATSSPRSPSPPPPPEPAPPGKGRPPLTRSKALESGRQPPLCNRPPRRKRAEQPRGPSLDQLPARGWTQISSATSSAKSSPTPTTPPDPLKTWPTWSGWDYAGAGGVLSSKPT